MTWMRPHARDPLLWALASVVLMRITTLGLYPLTDTTEARYAEIARKMVELGDRITPWFDYGVPFWGKPPLSFWLTAASFKLFGINEFAARLPHLLGAFLVIWLIWDWLAPRSHRESMIAIVLLAGSALFFIAAGAVMTDMTLTLGTTLSMRGFWLGLHGTDTQRRRERWLPFLGLAVGLLAKGPIVLVFVGLPIAAWTLTQGNLAAVWRGFPWLRGSLLTVALAGPWYVLAEWRTPGFLDYFLIGEHWQRFVASGWSGDLYGSAHAFPRGSIWLFAVVALVPWSFLLPIVALRWRKLAQKTIQTDRTEGARRLYLLFWGLTPCVFFSFASNILWTYELPGLPALALLGAAWFARYPEVQANRILFAGTASLMIAFAGYLANSELAGQLDLRSAKTLVDDYESRRSGSEPLIFLGQRPFSGVFYSRGKADLVPDAVQLAHRLANGPAFVVVNIYTLPSLPTEIREKLKSIARHGKYELLYSPSYRVRTSARKRTPVPLPTFWSGPASPECHGRKAANRSWRIRLATMEPVQCSCPLFVA